MKNFFFKNELAIARISMVAILLALIRTIGECFRLNSLASGALHVLEIYPYLAAAIICAIAVLAMTVFSFFGRNKTITIIAIITIAIMFLIKYVYIP